MGTFKKDIDKNLVLFTLSFSRKG